MAQKINNLSGILETFAEMPELKKVHITEDGRHFFNEQHAKECNGYTSKKEEGKKTVHEPKTVKYKTYAPDAAELKPETAA